MTSPVPTLTSSRTSTTGTGSGSGATEDDALSLARALDSLPTLPVVAIRLGELLHARRSSVGQIADLISSDPSLSAKLLRLVNSAYFGIPGGVTEVARAIPFVGFNTIYQLVLSVSVLETLKSPAGGVFDPRPLWLHSLAVASAARVIAEEIRHPEPERLFTAGLLHDMGKIALAKVRPDAFLSASSLIRDEGLTSVEAERRLGLPSHDRVGSDLARRWRLPAGLAVPIESHHVVLDPAVRDRMTPHHRVSAEVVAVADMIAREVIVTAGAAPEAHEHPAQRELRDALGVGDRSLSAMYTQVMAQLERSRPFLSLLDD